MMSEILVRTINPLTSQRGYTGYIVDVDPSTLQYQVLTTDPNLGDVLTWYAPGMLILLSPDGKEWLKLDGTLAPVG